MVKKAFNYAKVAVISGILGFIALPLVFGILAIIFAMIGAGKEQNPKLWQWALVLGIFDVFYWYFIVFTETGTKFYEWLWTF